MNSKKFFFITALIAAVVFFACNNHPAENGATKTILLFTPPDTASIPKDEFGKMVGYGRDILVNTAYYIGPEGKAGSYAGNKINCTNCHQDAGTKPYSFNLILSHDRYPQYRGREGAVLTLAARVNNCIERPLNGRGLPIGGKEMTAILSYLKWINDATPVKDSTVNGFENLSIEFMNRAADPEKGRVVYEQNCLRCHGSNGEGLMQDDNVTFKYPALWGKAGYQPGSSMHRIIKQARWLKANMPNDLARWNNTILTDDEALDVAAFINDDEIHPRPSPPSFDYPNIAAKNIDYGKGPFIDTFSEKQHKYGPYRPIIRYWKNKGWKPVY